MAFVQSELIFDPGLFANRSKRASRRRWVDGNFVRFRDGVPAQMGGYVELPVSGDTMAGRPCGAIAWRPNSLAGRLAVFGTHSHAYLYDGAAFSDITPLGFEVGRTSGVSGLGYGVGVYGDDDYGTPRTSSTVILSASSWSMDLFGEMLVACCNTDGHIYRFQPGVDTEMEVIAEAPTTSCVLVSAERHVFAFGADGNQRFVQWSDREDFTDWTPTSTKRAGGYEMQVTSAFQTAKRVRGVVVAWTLNEVVMFFPSFNATVYGRETLSETVGCCGPLAVAVIGNADGETAYWMADDGIYTFDGIVRRMNCELHDYIFRDINLDQKSKFVVSTNVEFSEVLFFYCSAASDEIDRCVVYCFDNNTWSKAHVDRTIWLDRGVFKKPLALNASGELFQHETGVSANGSVLPSFVLSHPMTYGVGQNFTDIGGFWPDLEDGSGAVDISLVTRDYPGDADLTHGPFRCAPSTAKIDLYVSARQYQVKVQGTGPHWELGIPLIETQVGGLA